MEGHEVDVLAGARQLIGSGTIDAVQFEFGGASIDTRRFLRDVVRELGPAYPIRRILPDGLSRPIPVDERDEIFVLHNYAALRQP